MTPKLAMTRTPTVNVGASGCGSSDQRWIGLTRRDALPMPALSSNARMPVPAPTTPRATGPPSEPRAPSIAARTSAASTWTGNGRLRSLSSHSATTGMIGSPRKPAVNGPASASTAPS